MVKDDALFVAPPMPDDDGLDIPAFLRISQDERREAWARYRTSGKPYANPRLDTGPGAVCRRLGCWTEADQRALEASQERSAAYAYAKRQEDEARWADLRAQAAKEKQDERDIQAAVAASGAAFVATLPVVKHRKPRSK